MIRFVDIFSEVVLCTKHAIYAFLITSAQNTGYCLRYFADKTLGFHFINMYTVCKYQTTFYIVRHLILTCLPYVRSEETFYAKCTRSVSSILLFSVISTLCLCPIGRRPFLASPTILLPVRIESKHLEWS